MTNQLIHTASPYLLQHANNPVDWYPWGNAALTRARTENKPIFLSIGYAACHWCHVMAHESFEDPETAALMNTNFICIKVDREERPDLDNIYMQATTALTGSGGWPMSVFLTPELKPFYAGTYFPPVRRLGLPAFKELLTSIAHAWAGEQEEVDRIGERVSAHLQTAKIDLGGAIFSTELLDAMTKSILDSYDWGYGGWGSAPKFPQPMSIDFLLRRSITKALLPEEALKAALHALKAMARGGMYDVVGGGFARYSTDNFWLVPHFEKMLYDNALLARAYLHAWQITREPFYLRISTETLDFVSRELTNPTGGFLSSLDADSDGKEGAYYVWTSDEIKQSFASNDDLEFFTTAYGLNDKGNWEGKTVLQRVLDDASLAARFRIGKEQVKANLAVCHAKLLSVRQTRIRPATDDKVLTSWNALMLATLAEASQVLDDKNKAHQYYEMATRNARFLLSSLRPKGKLHRSWRNGIATPEVFLEDFSALILGLLELYQTDFENHWFSTARELADEMIERFSDPRGGFFDTPDDAEALLVKPKDIQDNATPSGNALACMALLKLAALTDVGNYRDYAERGLNLVASSAARYPTSFAYWLSAADQTINNGKQIAVLFKDRNNREEPLLEAVRSVYRPNAIIAASVFPPSQDAPRLLQQRLLVKGMTTAYVCEQFSCKQPVNSTQDLLSQL